VTGEPTLPRPATAVPGPRGMPLFGSGPALVRDPLGTYQQAMETHGDIVRLVAGPPGRRVVLHALFAPEHARQVLAGTRGHTKQLPLYREIAAALGDGLLTSDGDDWQRQRRIVQPLFTRQRIAGYATVMAEEATRLLEGWAAAAASGRPVELHRQVTGYTMRVLGRLLLGSDLDAAIAEVATAFPVINQHIRHRVLAPLRPPRSWPTPANRRATRARQRLDQVVEGILQQRRGQAPGADDLLDRLLAAHDPATGQGLDDAELRAQVLLFLLAGHETTATALTFTLYLLGRHPDAQRRVRDEARGVLGDRVPTAKDAARLAYTTRVVKEAMRLYPPAYGIGRRTSHDEVIGGYLLPAGSAVIVSTWVLHRHPRHWDHPSVFDPDRFTPEREAARHRYAYLPFGAGPRACIGGSFALLEAVLATASIVRAYRLTTLPDPIPLAAGITLRPAASVPCTLQPAPT
jgi:cytochrome P450